MGGSDAPHGYRVDLHTHSVGSPDGGLSEADYRRALESGALDYIAITDHNTVQAAVGIKQALGELGERIIVGEEVMTTEGEIIGLYMREAVPGGLPLDEAVRRIADQGAVVYVPHPFESVRSGLSDEAFASIADRVDIVEVYNGRAVFQNRKRQATAAARAAAAAQAVSSDAHGWVGWRQTYSLLAQPPSRETLVELLHGARYSRRIVGFGIFYPKLNRWRNKRSGQ